MPVLSAHPHPLVAAILGPMPSSKVGALERFCACSSFAELVEAAAALRAFAQGPAANPYERVRALLQLYALYRFHLPERTELAKTGTVPYEGQKLLLDRRFHEAIEVFLTEARTKGLSDPLASALAAGYQALGFQMLAGQVQRSVRSLRGNRWMFRASHALDHPLRVRPELVERDSDGYFPLLIERTPVRMDLSHSGWSDIFFLGMDYPEGARVLNISIDLGVYGRDEQVVPPITCFLRVIEQPVLRLSSVDLDTTVELSEIAEVFDFARDYVGLLKAAVIASGIVPPGLEGSGQPLALVLEQLLGPGLGLELTSQVNNIPKGSRLAVSTNLLASLITICMRATRQVASLIGGLTEAERRMVAARAILGEWLGGSGGGWQDSGGLWAGIKLIEGVLADPSDVEYGSSRGRLLPRHTLLGPTAVPEDIRQRLKDSLVVVHGGMAANVGPILEMVTEKFLLGTTPEWEARQHLLRTFDDILGAVRSGDIRQFGRLATENFRGPLQTIIPWISNLYTERLIAQAEAAFGGRFWGFWMLGGMSGGGMGFVFDPAVKSEAEARMLEIMRDEKRQLEAALPFAMDPLVYRFAVNETGTTAELRRGAQAILSPEYYLFMMPRWLHEGSRSFSMTRQREIEAFARRDLSGPSAEKVGQALVQRLLPSSASRHKGEDSLDGLLTRYGFDRDQHEQIRADLRAGRIGLAKNRLPADTLIEDVRPGDAIPSDEIGQGCEEAGWASLKRGEAAVVTLAAGAGSRWTQGAGTVKALHPFAKIAGRFRTFVEVHLAKSRRVGNKAGKAPAHVFTTSHLTHAPIASLLERERYYDYAGEVRLSPGRSIGLRLVPTARDLRFAWEQMPQQKLEARKQKVVESGRKALIDWVISTGEASDYRDNLASQCVHPVGHWYEVANILLNGTLRGLCTKRPELRYLMLHNIDTLGADLDPRLLGRHIEGGLPLTFELIPRRYGDRGGGLARVGQRVRLLEGLAFPREEDEAKLTYYNSLTTWISIDPLLGLFGLTRQSLNDEQEVRSAVRVLAARLPTYIAIKDVIRRWGNAQEDIFPVAQFEKLWGDMTALPEVSAGFLLVSRHRGQQLKDVAQLDGWVRDGSREHVESLCDFG
jgi:hypothetical protein